MLARPIALFICMRWHGAWATTNIDENKLATLPIRTKDPKKDIWTKNKHPK